eukprot:SAG31_NODE_515_length_14710_cov_6.289097_6_plen_144_part_00
MRRSMAVLTEHYGGKWPFWLSPRQAIVIPISKDYNEYAEKVAARLHSTGFYVDVERGAKTVQRAVRDAQLAQYNFILCVGAQEVCAVMVHAMEPFSSLSSITSLLMQVANGTVSVRVRDQSTNKRYLMKKIVVLSTYSMTRFI